MRQVRNIVFLLLLLPTPIFSGEASSLCSLESDPLEEIDILHACFEGVWSSSGIHSQNDGEVIYSKASGYFSLHLNKGIAVHGSGYFSQASQGGEPNIEIRRTEALFLAIGNPIVDRWQVLLGRYHTPIGLNESDFDPTYHWIYKRDIFWRSQDSSLTVSYSDLAGTALEITYSDPQYGTEKGEKGVMSLGLRASSDLSALGGTKVILSYFTDSEKIRKYGFALLNNNAGGGKTFVEWFRVYGLGGTYGFEQLIRLGYTSPFRFGTRWVFEYEDDSSVYFITQLGHDFRLSDGGLILRLSAAYFRSRFQQVENHWSYGIGLQYRL